MQRIIVFSIFILMQITISCSARDKCKKLLAEKVDINFILNNKAEFVSKINLLIECEFEPIDKEVLFGNDNEGMIIKYLTLYLENSPSSENMTYGNIKEIIEDLANTKDYKIGKQIINARDQIIDKKAKIDSWEIDYKLLLQMNLTELDISLIKKIIENNENENLTYHEVLQEFANLYDATNTLDCPAPSYFDIFYVPYNLDCYFEISESIECSKTSNMPVLVYFTGHGSFKSRDFEANILSDQEILKLIKQKFVFTNLFTDDVSIALPEHQIYLENTNDTLIKIGKINQYYQKEYFNDEIQPAFYIIDSIGNQMNSFHYYNGSIDSFREFLINGIKNYYDF